MQSNLIKKLIWFAAIFIIVSIFTVVITITYFSFDLPKIKSIADYNPPIPSKIFSADGVVLAEIGKEKREIVQVSDVPRHIIESFLAAEDDNFYQHKGVDYVGVLRAMWANLKAGKVVQGGSTITQQLAKSLLLSRERSFSRKTKDFLLAQKIEEQFSKEEILYLYLNQIYLGGGYYGVKEGFRGYYGKELNETTIAEAALIAGLLVAPTKYSPYVNPIFAKRRQGYVLRRLLETGKINEQEYKTAISERVKFKIKQYSEFKAGHFTDWIRQRMIDHLGEEEFLVGGYSIQTSLDYALQEVAQAAVLKGVDEIDKRQGFKGPVENIPSEEIEKWILAYCKKILESSSNYFTINEEGEKEYEFNYSEKEILDEFKIQRESFDQNIKLHTRGNTSQGTMSKILNRKDIFKAVVVSINDDAKLVTVSLGTKLGIIDQSGFSWAHKREISEEPLYFPSIQKPSTILSIGDVIDVKILKEEAGLLEHVNDPFRKSINKELSAILQKEKFLLLSLEQVAEVQGALIALDSKTGHIVSFVGGNDFSKSQFNRVIQSQRQPGSCFKPFIYTLALENGFTPASIIMDSPESLIGAEDGPNWKPKNYDGQYLGAITLRTSLEKSRNVPTIKLANELGLNEMTKFLKRIGLSVNLGQDLSFSLGSFGVNLFELAKSYALFPTLGKRVSPISILSVKDRNGVESQFNENEPIVKTEKNIENSAQNVNNSDQQLTAKQQFTVNLSEDQVLDKRIAYLTTNILKGVIRSGTATSARVVGTNIAGKTGTTSNYVDAWFVGFNHNLIVGTWTGFDENQTLGFGETGTKSALPIWTEYMQHAIKKYGDLEFKQPAGLINLYINKNTGEQISPSSLNAFLETFAEGFEPGSRAANKKPIEEMANKKNRILFEEDDFIDQE